MQCFVLCLTSRLTCPLSTMDHMTGVFTGARQDLGSHASSLMPWEPNGMKVAMRQKAMAPTPWPDIVVVLPNRVFMSTLAGRPSGFVQPRGPTSPDVVQRREHPRDTIGGMNPDIGRSTVGRHPEPPPRHAASSWTSIVWRPPGPQKTATPSADEQTTAKYNRDHWNRC
jgi:hypothetical protein